MKNHKILVVDDEDAIRNQCSRILKKEEVALMTARDGEEALEFLKKYPFDVVLTDLVMPGSIDGKRLLQLLRANFPDMDVIIMTAHPTMESAIAAIRQGAYDYLLKPFTPEELCRVLHRCLEKRELKKKLEESYKEIKMMHDSREMFMQLLVHDMKNPLAGIMGNAHVLLMDDLNEEQRETALDILKSAERLQQMVSNLLDIGAMESSLLKLTPKSIFLSEMVEETKELFALQLAQKKIKFNACMQPKHISFRGDRDLFLRILQNLLDNSLHYTPDGGEITLEAFQNEEDAIHLRVKDTGQGISKEYRETIFTRYGRITRSGERTNRGLGLYFCKLAVEAHKGTIQMEETKQGCSFLIRLPKGETNRIDASSPVAVSEKNYLSFL